MNAAKFKGKTFKIFKYRIMINFKAIDIYNGITGRVYFFPWARYFK